MEIFFWGALMISVTIVCAVAVRRNREIGAIFLFCMLSFTVISSNVFASRLIELNFFYTVLIVSSGSIIWPLSSQISDMINEIYGREIAISAIFIAYLGNIFLLISFEVVSNFDSIWPLDNEVVWSSFFNTGWRIFLASTITFFTVGILNAYIFDLMKRRSYINAEKMQVTCWLIKSGRRSLISDVISMLIDSALFAILAFAFVVPFDQLLLIIFSSILVKCFLTFIDTPLFVFFQVVTRPVKRHSVKEGISHD